VNFWPCPDFNFGDTPLTGVAGWFAKALVEREHQISPSQEGANCAKHLGGAQG
jgi:hypothetical protein